MLTLINIELMNMKCPECNSNKNEFDERLGERCCSDCGLVLIRELFEDTVSSWKGNELIHSSDKGHLGSKPNKYDNVSSHIRLGISHCKMVLAFLGLSLNSERIDKVYMELYRKHMLRGFSFEERATAIVYYLLKENGTPQPIKKVNAEFSANIKRVNKLIRKINQHYKNAIHFNNNNSFLIHQTARKVCDEPLFLHQANKVMEHLEVVLPSSFNKNKTYFAAVCVIASEVFVRGFSIKMISEKNGFSRNKVSKETKRIIGIFGYISVKELKGKELEKIGE